MKSIFNRVIVVTTLFVLSTSILGCEDQSDLERATEDIEAASSDIEKAAKELEESIEGGDLEGALGGLGKALGQLGGVGSDEEIEIIDFRELKELCPENIGDFERTSSSGEKTTFGITVSTAECSYKHEDDSGARFDLNISDIGSISGLASLGLAWFNADFEREGDDGYEKTVDFRDHRAMEKFTFREGKNGSGEFNILVGKRLHVEMSARSIEEGDFWELRDDFDWRRAEKLVD